MVDCAPVLQVAAFLFPTCEKAARTLQQTMRYGSQMKMYSPRALLILMFSAALATESVHAAPDTLRSTALLAPASAATTSGCWARIYKDENFAGEVVALIGPSEVANVPTRLGFPWDPQFKSLVVGPKGVFSVFDLRNFRERTATFDGGQKVADLDNQMGVFRTIRSMKLSCTK